MLCTSAGLTIVNNDPNAVCFCLVGRDVLGGERLGHVGRKEKAAVRCRNETTMKLELSALLLSYLWSAKDMHPQIGRASVVGSSY